MMMKEQIDKTIRIKWPNDDPERVQNILKDLRNNKYKDHHCAGSLTHLGRCALDYAAADLIEYLIGELEVTKATASARVNELEFVLGLTKAALEDIKQELSQLRREMSWDKFPEAMGR